MAYNVLYVSDDFGRADDGMASAPLIKKMIEKTHGTAVSITPASNLREVMNVLHSMKAAGTKIHLAITDMDMNGMQLAGITILQDVKMAYPGATLAVSSGFSYDYAMYAGKDALKQFPGLNFIEKPGFKALTNLVGRGITWEREMSSLPVPGEKPFHFVVRNCTPKVEIVPLKR